MKKSNKFSFDEASAIWGYDKKMVMAYFKTMSVHEFSYDRNFCCDPHFLRDGYFEEGTAVNTDKACLIQLYITQKGISAFIEGLEQFSLVYGEVQEGAKNGL